MKSSAQVVVIGGGVVGASVLYHLAKAGWTDAILLERRELTAGSTWHAAGGLHTLNGDPNVARLQQYTINLYQEIERVSGQSCSIHLCGGLMLAEHEDRMDFLRMAVARGRYLGMQLELITPNEARDLFPVMDPKYFVGALYDHFEGHVDPTGVTLAYVKCAQQLGGEVYTHTPVTGLAQRPDGTWDVEIENGDPIHTEHVVNAGGLWAREVGRMVGLELPVLAMEHQYVLTVPVPEVQAWNKQTGKELPMTIDFGGEIYVRQEADGGMLLGTYEQAAVPWSPKKTPWDFGSQLLKPDLDRITPEMSVASKHIPTMATVGLKRVVNGPFTFAPDGNPLVGPIRGLRGYWVACGVMAGLSQGGGVGLALAAWMTAGDAGDSGMDIFAMDIARFGDYANLAYTNAKVQENYRRRFQITFPNEELPAGRPLLTTPIYDRLTTANAVWGATMGLEHALWFQKAALEPKEDVTFHRSNAWDCVAEEVRAVRTDVGMTEISNYAKYRVTGAGASEWLSSLLTQRMPTIGRITLTAMLNDAGRIFGEFTVARPAEAEEFYLFGSLPAEVQHSRWFRHQLPKDGSIRFEVLGLALVGLSVTGPRSRDLMASIAPDLDISTEAFPFMTFRKVDLGMTPALLGRINYSGELGYEIWLAPEQQRALFDRIVDAGKSHGLRLFGMRALMSLRLEKSYGTWFREYRPIYTIPEAGLHRYVKLDHEFIGRAAYEAQVAEGPSRRLVTLLLDPDPEAPADVFGDEPIWHDGAVVGWVTSGGYGHFVGQSIALGYVPADLADASGRGGAGFEIEVVGRRRPARIQSEPLHDPQGLRMRQ